MPRQNACAVRRVDAAPGPASRVATTRGRLTPRTARVAAIALFGLGGWWLASDAPLLAQSPEAARDEVEVDPWEPLRLLEGTWEGTIDGRLGQGVGRRRYELVVDDRYLMMKQASVRLPQEKSPAGDHHRELTIYSFDRERGTIVLREFMVEGYVLRSTCETEPRRIVCTAEEIENGPGMRSRLTIEISDPYRFVETFELASPGEELQHYFTNTWTRVPDLRDVE